MQHMHRLEFHFRIRTLQDANCGHAWYLPPSRPLQPRGVQSECPMSSLKGYPLRKTLSNANVHPLGFTYPDMADALLQNEKVVERPLSDTQAVDETQSPNDVPASDPESSPRTLHGVKVSQQTQTRNICRSQPCD